MAIDGSTSNTTACAGLANIQFETVPEPSSMVILAAGLVLLGLGRDFRLRL